MEALQAKYIGLIYTHRQGDCRGSAMNTTNNQGYTIQRITPTMLGKVYTDMDGTKRTLDKRAVYNSIPSYLVTDRHGKSKIMTSGQIRRLAD